MPGVDPKQNGPDSFAIKASQAPSPSRLAKAAHSVTFSSANPSWRSRFSTFRFCTGWVSQASAMAKARTLARRSESFGNSGGSG